MNPYLDCVKYFIESRRLNGKRSRNDKEERKINDRMNRLHK